MNDLCLRLELELRLRLGLRERLELRLRLGLGLRLRAKEDNNGEQCKVDDKARSVQSPVIVIVITMEWKHS